MGRDVPGAALAGAETLGELSDPAEAIARSAELCGVDVIVIGAHERSWVDRLLHRPPLPRGIVERATAPVLVVH